MFIHVDCYILNAFVIEIPLSDVEAYMFLRIKVPYEGKVIENNHRQLGLTTKSPPLITSVYGNSQHQ